MKRSRRDFMKLGTGAMGSLAVPLESLKGLPGGESPSVLVDREPPDGMVTVSPAEGIAGEYGTWTMTYRAGKEGIRKYGGLRVQLPDAWHAGIRNSANRLQATDPSEDNYISSRSSRTEVRLRTWVENEPPRGEGLVKSPRHGLDGRYERYIYVVRVWLLEGELKEGDTVSVIYGDTSRGSKGMRAAIISTHPEPILLAVDTDGTGEFRLHPDRPTLVAHAAPAAELLLTGPSTLVIGKPAELHVGIVDAHANPAASYNGEVELRVTQGQAEVPARLKFRSRLGWETLKFIPREAGILRIEASAEQGRLRAAGNPMKVFQHEPKLKIYWGELHSHTHYSWDGVGDDNFRYARYVSGLDFYAMTDHSVPAVGKFTQGLGPQVWDEYTARTDQHYDPAKFVTLHAYECSFGAPYGHHNVFFRGKPGPLLMPGDVTLPQLWAALKAGEALTIPHHTGKMPQPIFWYPHNPELDRNIEIYSAHGLSEAYNPMHPLSFERSTFTDPSRSVRGPQYAQDAWIQGLELSTVAASDDHRAHPGQPHWGVAAVAATGLTRDEIFDGLYHRRTYGTTGVRIVLVFTINGQPMGSQVTASGPPRLEIEAHGTDIIEVAEVLRYSKSDDTFKVIYSLNPGAADLTWNQADETFREDSIYYMRLRQAGLVRTRVAMAWSSPIWVKRS